jgi:hypothetical protein
MQENVTGMELPPLIERKSNIACTYASPHPIKDGQISSSPSSFLGGRLFAEPAIAWDSWRNTCADPL